MKKLSDELLNEVISNLKEDIRDLKKHDKNNMLTTAASWLIFLEELKEYRRKDWIPCTVVDHPEHCNYCEITYQDTRGYSRGIGYYADRWRLVDGEVPVIVVAWKEPSKPYEVVS